MGPQHQLSLSGELFQQVLAELINRELPVVNLAEPIPWPAFKIQNAAPAQVAAYGQK